MEAFDWKGNKAIHCSLYAFMVLKRLKAQRDLGLKMGYFLKSLKASKKVVKIGKESSKRRKKFLCYVMENGTIFKYY